jgi:hypothetical protein
VPAQEPKKGLRYEILVASELKTRPQVCDGKSLDLRSFSFNVNPQSFVSDLTRIGFDITVDLMAIRDNLTYFVECKSSDRPGDVLRLGSEEFLKAMLEFVALHNFSITSKWSYQYLLAINIEVGKDLLDLFKNTSTEQINRLSDKLKDFGTRKYGNKFNNNMVSNEILKGTLNATIILHLTDQYLKEKYRSDGNFRQHCEDFSAKWRTLRSNLIPSKGAILSPNYPRISFRCKSETHDNCTELAIAGFVCHIRDVPELLDKIRTVYEKMGSPVCCLVRSREIGYSHSDIEVDEKTSSKEVAGALSDALNNSLRSVNNTITVLMVPGTYDIAIVDTAKLAGLVRSAFDPFSSKYNLKEILELRGMGILVKTLLAREVMRQEFKIITSLDDYFADEDDDGEYYPS